MAAGTLYEEEKQLEAEGQKATPATEEPAHLSVASPSGKKVRYVHKR